MKVKFNGKVLDLPDGATYQDAQKAYNDQYGAPIEQAALPGAPQEAQKQDKGFLSTIKENVISALNARPEDLKEGAPKVGMAQFKPQEEWTGVVPGDQTGAARRASRMLGFGQGVADTGIALGQMLGARDLAAKEQAGYQDLRNQLGSEGYDWSRLAGNLVAPGGAAKLSKTGGAIRQGATSGAISGLLTPVEEEEGATLGDFLQSKVGQALTGTAAGGVLGKLFGKAANGPETPKTGLALAKLEPEDLSVIRGKNAVNLDDIDAYKKAYGKDIYNTPGQMNGLFSGERKLTSVPFAGGDISEGLNRSVREYNVAEMQNVLKPLGIKLDNSVTPGRDMMASVQNNLSKRYDKLLDQAQIKDPIRIGEEIIGKIDNNGNRINGLVDEQLKLMTVPAQEKFVKDFQTLVMDKFPKGPKEQGLPLNGQQFKNMEEGIKKYIKKRATSANGDEREQAQAMEDVLSHLYVQLEGSGQAGKELQKLNKVYAQFKTLENASIRKTGSEGIFTPSDVLQESKKWSKSSFAKAATELQQRNELANRVIGNHVPDSGTAGRAAIQGIIPLAKGAALSALSGPLYSKPGTKVAQGMAKGSTLAAPIGSSQLSRLLFGPSYQGEQ